MEENGVSGKGRENGGGEGSGSPNMLQFWTNIQGHIQDLVKTAMVNAKDDDDTKSVDSAGRDGESQLCGMFMLPSPQYISRV